MNLQDIRDLYDYNYWANQRLLDTSEKVTLEQFTAPSSHSFGSLQGTLLHNLDAEFNWRLLLQGQGVFLTELKASDFPTIAAIQQRWLEEEQAMWVYLDGLTDQDLTGMVRYEGDGGVLRERLLWHCLFHVVNHGMQHRSVADALLTSYGQSPGDIDFTLFLNERKTHPK